MTTGRALLIALLICVLAATLEGVCAGKNVKTYFASLKFPPYSAPLWVWYIIGGIYYLVFLFVTYRVLRHDLSSRLVRGTTGLILLMMAINALWNYVFFRRQALFLSFVVTSLFPLFDLVLLICLIRFDTTAAWGLIPYLTYRVYGVWWGYGLWKWNRSAKTYAASPSR